MKLYRSLNYLFGILAILLIYSCQKQRELEKDEISHASVSDIDLLSSEIKISSSRISRLEIKQIVNGTIEADQKVVVKFESSGQLIFFSLRDGDRIHRNQIISRIDQTALNYELRLLQTKLTQAKLDRDERILLLGGEYGLDSSVSIEQLSYIETKAGIRYIEELIEEKEYYIGRMTTMAPFSGIVSDVLVRQFQQVSQGESMCTLINPTTFEASFDLLETSISSVVVGQKLKVFPIGLPNSIYNARVTRINPVVNASGLVNVKARITGDKSLLLEGMKIRVELLTETEPHLIIPKNALVLRSERDVVFTYDSTEQVAKWNYVKIAHENDVEVAISEGLEKEALIIIDGNHNLDNDARVVIVEK